MELVQGTWTLVDLGYFGEEIFDTQSGQSFTTLASELSDIDYSWTFGDGKINNDGGYTSSIMRTTNGNSITQESSFNRKFEGTFTIVDDILTLTINEKPKDYTIIVLTRNQLIVNSIETTYIENRAATYTKTENVTYRFTKK